MMDGRAIRALSEEMAVKAAEEGKEPLEVNTFLDISGDPHIDEDSMRLIPHLGDYEPPGWESMNWIEVDKGFGAISAGWDELLEWAEQEMLDGHVGFAICEEAQFTIVISSYRPV